MRDLLFDAEAAASRTPERAAQENMRPVLPKRFYKEVTVAEEVGETPAFAILLDGRSVKTPAKSKLVLPTRQAASLIAEEWERQEELIDPGTMPKTRLVNTAIDGIANEAQAVLEDIVRFAANDLLFYRASHPDTLVELQRKHWDAVLDWYETRQNMHFETTEGISHIPQPKEAITLFSAAIAKHDAPMKLACLHTATSLTGSALLAFALAEGALSLEDSWVAAHVDEDFNISQWGEDYEAGKRRRLRFSEMTAAHDLFRAL
jgi:chaperone required for assembly of F1-ATPase